MNRLWNGRLIGRKSRVAEPLESRSLRRRDTLLNDLGLRNITSTPSMGVPAECHQRNVATHALSASHANRHLDFNFLSLVRILGDVDCAQD